MGEGLSAGTRSFRAKSDYRMKRFAVEMTNIASVWCVQDFLILSDKILSFVVLKSPSIKANRL
jgi:hypothetical protein